MTHRVDMSLVLFSAAVLGFCSEQFGKERVYVSLQVHHQRKLGRNLEAGTGEAKTGGR